MSKLTYEQRQFLKLVDRSPSLDNGWKQVSKVLWDNHVMRIYPAVKALVDLNHDEMQIRLSAKGQLVMEYL